MLIQAGMSRDKRKTKVDQSAAAILLQSYLDSSAPSAPVP
jgi:RNase H-fold protein (predicted Holliday junction resolvase)